MSKPVLQVEPSPSPASLARATRIAIATMGELVVSDVLPARLFTASETIVAHGFGGTPQWMAFGHDAPAIVYQTRPPTREFLYLAASADVTCKIAVF